MNQIFEQYIEHLVMEVVSKNNLMQFQGVEREQKISEIRSALQMVVLDTILQQLSDEHLEEVKKLDFKREESYTRLSELVAEVPELDRIVQEALEEKVKALIANPS